MAGDDDEMFMTRSLNVTPKTTEQRILIARSDKSVAYVLTIKDSTRRFVLLKLTTDRHEARAACLRQQSYLIVTTRVRWPRVKECNISNVNST